MTMTHRQYLRYMHRYNAKRRSRLSRRQLCTDCGRSPRRLGKDIRGRLRVLCMDCCARRMDRWRRRKQMTL